MLGMPPEATRPYQGAEDTAGDSVSLAAAALNRNDAASAATLLRSLA